MSTTGAVGTAVSSCKSVVKVVVYSEFDKRWCTIRDWTSVVIQKGWGMNGGVRRAKRRGACSYIEIDVSPSTGFISFRPYEVSLRRAKRCKVVRTMLPN